MMRKRLLGLWLAWMTLAWLICGRGLGHGSGSSSQAHYSDALRAFMRAPASHELQAQPVHQQQQQQQQMLEAMQRQHRAQELHLQSRPQAPPAPHVPSAAAPAPPPEQVLAAQAARWPDGYMAVCAVVKDQGRDLRYWIEYHRWLGVSKFYIFDNNSTLPAMLVLWDYLREGLVEYQYFLGRPRKLPDFADSNQYRAYQACLLQHFRQHRWLAFIDVDEFFVLRPDVQAAGAAVAPVLDNAAAGGGGGSAARALLQQQHEWQRQWQQAARQQQADWQQSQQRSWAHRKRLPDPGRAAGVQPVVGAGSQQQAAQRQAGSSASGNSSVEHSLPLFLSRYERYGALGVNWVLFGSSGLAQRPPAGPLGSYTACVSQQHWESTHVKVIANTAGILGIGHTPHDMQMRPGVSTVDVDGKPFTGPKTPTAKWHKLVLHHYVLKSRAEFATKAARGSGAGNAKNWGYFTYLEELCNSTCSQGLNVSAAFLASGPRLAQPKGGHFCSRGTQRAAAGALAGAVAKVLAQQPSPLPQPQDAEPSAGGAPAGDAGEPSSVDDDDAYGWPP